jgi:Zn-dependent M28 family amino/carboxypeptidase
MLEVASRMARATTKPARSIVFVAFTAEEEGLIGSQRFVKDAPVPLDHVVGMVNLDMVGRIRNTPSSTNIAGPPSTTRSTTTQSSGGRGILYVGGTGTAKDFDDILKRAGEHSPLVLKDMGRGGLGPSDHMSFALKKVPVLFFFSGLHADYHRPTDDADKINYDGLEQAVELVQDVITQIAAEPRQRYVDANDSSSMHMARGSSGSSVTLGVVPDYSAMEESGGVKISGTSPGSPAAAAGLRDGDTIVKWNDRKIDNLYDLTDALAKGKAGEKVHLSVVREKKQIELDATLAKRAG